MATEERTQGSPEGLPESTPAPAGPGLQLREAREVAGLSLDQVAQQLKLAPRQVKALEDENFTLLPGRTFSRGFVRNYARLLGLDPEDLLARMPDAGRVPALEAPALQSTGTMIAELPNRASAKSSFARWLIPLVLIGCVVAAAAYEWYRGGLTNPNEPQRAAGNGAAVKPRAAAPVTPGTQGQESGVRGQGSDASAGQASNTQASNQEQGVGNQRSTVAGSTITSTPLANPLSVGVDSTPDAGDTLLRLTFSGPSWTEIRDRNGQVLIARLVAADSVEAINGMAPFDVVLGNAHVVALTYRGRPVDLVPYTRQNVARLTLK